MDTKTRATRHTKAYMCPQCLNMINRDDERVVIGVKKREQVTIHAQCPTIYRTDRKEKVNEAH